MNGKPLTREHGAPLRSLVPGFIGARSVKWLGKIVVSDRPSPNHFLKDVYKLVTEDTPAAAQAADPIYEFALNCAMVPREAPKRGDRNVGLRGYALPPGAPDVTIDRVEISSDDGKTWARARLEDPSQAFCSKASSSRRRCPGTSKATCITRIIGCRSPPEPCGAVRSDSGYNQPDGGEAFAIPASTR
jgi:sulfite oxidase